MKTLTLNIVGYFPPSPNRVIGKGWRSAAKYKKLAADYVGFALY